MASKLLFFAAIVFCALFHFKAMALTDSLDVQALQDLYRALNRPPQLKEWKLEGGDPCEEQWTGVSCSDSSVIHIKLPGHGLTGNLGFQLSNLQNLKQLDLSSNNIEGEIPYSLPLNVTHLNLACNKFILSIPYSLTSMKNLRHLNLSHNALSGPVGDVFNGLNNLKEIDLSYNNFTGDLPSSFGFLTNLTRLFLQNNGFTGSVIYLAYLPLSDLNIQDNHFSGVIPQHFQSIHNLWLGGNKFHRGNYPAWSFPLDNVPNDQNITSPPTTESSAIESYPSHKAARHERKFPTGIACLVGGGTLVAFCAALVIAIHIHRSRAEKRQKLEGIHSSHSLPISTVGDISATTAPSPLISSLGSPFLPVSRHIHSFQTRMMKVHKRKSFSGKSKAAMMKAKSYSIAELQTATNSFSEDNFLGKGSLGSVYRAEFPDGQILAVKNVNTVVLSLDEEDQFLEVILNAARLRHPNIVSLRGYCVEHGQHLLVYEFVRNLTLDDALHGEGYLPLTWKLRLQIAFGIARALDYLHTTCVPSVAHGNLKAANILFDQDMMPRLCDCGLGILRSLSSNSVKLKASEMAIEDMLYLAPEQEQSGINNTKADIYAFGVLLLELLTGRRPLEGSRPREEQCLVKWASSRLHDSESLEEMVDPAIKRTVPPKVLSRFADIVSLCIQPEKEFRPPMSEIVESLKSIVPKPGKVKGNLGDSVEVEPSDKSFRTSNTRFLASPTASFFSI